MATFKTTVTLNITREQWEKWKACADAQNEYLSRWCIMACEAATGVRLPDVGDACPQHAEIALRSVNGWLWCNVCGPLRSIGPHAAVEAP